MAELFKVQVQKYAKGRTKQCDYCGNPPGGDPNVACSASDGHCRITRSGPEAVFVVVKTYEVRDNVLRLLAQDVGRRPDGSAGRHHLTAGPFDTDKSLEIVECSFVGRIGQSNAHVSVVPEVPADLDAWLKKHSAEGWAVP